MFAKKNRGYQKALLVFLLTGMIGCQVLFLTGCEKVRWTRRFHYKSDYSFMLPDDWKEEVIPPEWMYEEAVVQYFLPKDKEGNVGSGRIKISNWRFGQARDKIFEELKEKNQPVLEQGELETDFVKSRWFVHATEEGKMRIHYVWDWERGFVLRFLGESDEDDFVDYREIFEQAVESFRIQ